MKAGAISLFIAALLVFHLPAGAMALGRLDGNRSLNDKKHGYAISSDVARAGKKSQRFEVRAGDCGEEIGWSDCANDRERSEIIVKKHGLMEETSGLDSAFICHLTSRPVLE